MATTVSTLSSLLLILFCLLNHLVHLHHPASAYNTSASPITALYVFGDSTVDPGNNDYIPAVFKANHYPYGINFPGRVPTGRFSDGLLATDFIASSLGLKDTIPPFLDPSVTDQDLLTGVSFASAGSGLDEGTLAFTHALDLMTQIENFKKAVNQMERTAGREKTAWIVQKAVFLISVGTNDMMINYYDLPTRRLQYSSSGYSDFILSRLRSVIQSLYNLGARRFVVVGLPPVGCLPIQVTLNSAIPSSHWLQRACVDSQNEDAQLHNSKLQSLLNDLESKLGGARIAYCDVYFPVLDMINHPQSYGFEKTLEGCCGTGDLETAGLCNTKLPICSNPSAYIFWDAVHPTQVTGRFIADKSVPGFLAKLLN